jgi:hypothetical protein
MALTGPLSSVDPIADIQTLVEEILASGLTCADPFEATMLETEASRLGTMRYFLEKPDYPNARSTAASLDRTTIDQIPRAIWQTLLDIWALPEHGAHEPRPFTVMYIISRRAALKREIENLAERLIDKQTELAYFNQPYRGY